MKKAIIICSFVVLILITAVAFVCGAVESYQYDMDPQNGEDLLEGWGAAFALIIGAFVVLYEVDLFYTIYYFCFKARTPVRSVLNILSNLSLLTIFVFYNLIMYSGILIFLFLAYIVLRLIYASVSLIFF